MVDHHHHHQMGWVSEETQIPEKIQISEKIQIRSGMAKWPVELKESMWYACLQMQEGKYN